MLVGRSNEQAAIDRLLTAAREGHSGALVLRGEAGIGKSALLEHARERAGGFTVLRGVGIESESELVYAALHQILRPVLNRIDQLPDPQAASLRAAFALSDETVDDRFRVSLGALTILAEAAEERPVLCLVDDAQWLDQGSAAALVFAARRLKAESLVMLFAARDDETRPFVAPDLPELRLSSLSSLDSRLLLSDRLGPTVPAGVVEWLAESANGNALALVELPATLTDRQLAGQDPVSGTLPPATSVEHIYLEKVNALSEPVRRLLVLAAAEETGARATVERAAAELGLDIGELTAAEVAGLLRVDAEQIVFRHPLVRSAIYRGAGFIDRERAHRTLAVVSAAEGSADRAAWHRAAATVGTDDEVARELEETADRARLRSGHAAAAAALDRAAELSGDTDSKARRLVTGAAAAWKGGRPEHATALLDRAGPIVLDPRLRAELDHVRGAMGWRCGELLASCEILMTGAASVPPVDSRHALRMLVDAGLVAIDAGDYARVAEAGQRAAALPRSEDEEDAFLRDLLVGVGSLTEGKTAHEIPLVVEAIARATDFDDPSLLIWAAVGASAVGEEEIEATILRRAVAVARASAAVDTLTTMLVTFTVSGWIANRFAVGAEAAEGLRLAKEAGLPNAARLHLASLAWLAAVKGRDDECRAYAADVNESARANGHGLANSIAEWAVALLDLSIGRPDATATRLASLSTAPAGVGHPYMALNSAPDLVEACVRTNREETAQTAFAMLEGFARRGAPNWALGLAARCRALLATDSEVERNFEEALRLHADANRPFDRARTQLLYGEFLRRERRRTDAREHLRAAVEAFEDLGAAHWEERARAELRASGETSRKRDASTLADLTPQELQIARLVAEGSSNKEVAAQLFLSPRTVEYHLRKIFMKLGISSRSELIRHGVGGEAEHEEATVALS
jgi:DNA-binding CsgD family transcriptional regulator